MTDEYAEERLDWLRALVHEGTTKPCPYCGAQDWQSGGLRSIPATDTNPPMRAMALVCSACGFVAFFTEPRPVPSNTPQSPDE